MTLVRLRDVLPKRNCRKLGLTRHNDGSVTVRSEFMMQTLDYAMERGWECPDANRFVEMGEDIRFVESGSRTVARMSRTRTIVALAGSIIDRLGLNDSIYAYAGSRTECRPGCTIFASDGSDINVGLGENKFEPWDRGVYVFGRPAVHAMKGAKVYTHRRSSIYYEPDAKFTYYDPIGIDLTSVTA